MILSRGTINIFFVLHLNSSSCYIVYIFISVSPLGKFQRKSWTTDEVKSVKSHFSDHLRNKQLPNLSECVQVIHNDAV